VHLQRLAHADRTVAGLGQYGHHLLGGQLRLHVQLAGLLRRADAARRIKRAQRSEDGLGVVVQAAYLEQRGFLRCGACP